MAGYIGSKAVLLSTTAATVTGDMKVDVDTLFVDSTNNRVGIGTSSPSSTLTIADNGTIEMLGGSSVLKFTREDTTTIAGNPLGAIEFAHIDADDAGVAAKILGEGDGSTGEGRITLHTGTPSALTERVRLDSTGGLRVGNTTNIFNAASSERLSVKNTNVGCAATLEATDVTGGYPILYLRTTDTASGQNAILFYRTNTLVGSITTTASSTAYNTSSDYRLKEDVQPMVGASDRLMALKPVNFAWKTDGTRVDGFLAHEAQEVVPEAVVGEKDAVDADGNPKYQGIDQSKLVPLLTAALQEALQKIDALEARVATLEGGAA